MTLSENNIKIYQDIDLSHLCCICNPDIISNDYELLVLSTPEDVGGIGFTYETNGIIHSIAIFDTNPFSTFTQYSEHPLQEINLQLLCSNYLNRIPGATIFLLRYCIEYFKEKFPNKDVIVLKSAGNPNTVKFYETFGFKHLSPYQFIYYLNKPWYL